MLVMSRMGKNGAKSVVYLFPPSPSIRCFCCCWAESKFSSRLHRVHSIGHFNIAMFATPKKPGLHTGTRISTPRSSGIGVSKPRLHVENTPSQSSRGDLVERSEVNYSTTPTSSRRQEADHSRSARALHTPSVYVSVWLTPSWSIRSQRDVVARTTPLLTRTPLAATSMAHHDVFDAPPVLHDAVLRGSFTLVSELLASNSNVNYTDRYGCTPLHIACMKCDIAIARYVRLQLD